ncbi:hypothetical protein [Paraburkholderia sp. BCC1886]|nr:hypothetical protein [Paraburkholderia sp. BCC1886]
MSLKALLLERWFQYQKSLGFRPDYIVQNPETGDHAEPAEKRKEESDDKE